MSQPCYFVTGGAGFVGANVVRLLQEQQPNALVVVIDDFRVGTFANLSREKGQGFSFQGHVIARSLHELDLFDLYEQFEPQAIFHLASITDTTVTDQAQMIQHNVEPFETLLALAVEKGVKLVWSSSAATYGTQANGATKEQRPYRLQDAGRPANVYGFSKWIMENLHRQTLEQHPQAHLVGLRYFNVFGPGEQDKKHMASMIYQLANQMLQGKRPRIFHDGSQARDHVYVIDVAEATIAGASDKAQSGIYNIGTGQATSFNQIIAYLNQSLDTNLAPDYFQNPYAFYQGYTCADLTETRKGLGWSPRYTTEQGVKEYVPTLRPH